MKTAENTHGRSRKARQKTRKPPATHNHRQQLRTAKKARKAAAKLLEKLFGTK